MKIKKQSWASLSIKGGMALTLLAILLAGLAVSPASAYSGGYAVGFEGLGSVIMINHTGVLGTVDACRDLKSISAWVKPLGLTHEGPQAGNLQLIVADAPVWFGISRGTISDVGSPDYGKDRIWVFNTNTSFVEQRIGIEYTVGEWVHVAFVHSGGVLSAYRNGIFIGSVASGTTHTLGCQKLAIGGKFTGPREDFFEGQIDDVALWRAALDGPTIRRWMYREVDSSHPSWSSLGAYYSMLPGSGTTVSDDSPNDYYGTFFNYSLTPGYSPVWLTSGAYAGPRYAYNFDGVDDYVTVPSSLSMPAALTLEASIYPRDLTGSKWIVGESGGARLVSNGTTLEFSIHDGTALRGPATATLALNTWQHVAGVFDGSTLQVYVNGAPGTSYSFSGSNQDMGGALMLASPDGSTQFTNILIDEVRLWNVARSVAQIRGNMYQTLQATESGLTAYYRMDPRGDGTMYDITIPSEDGTLNGMQTGSATSGTTTTITQSGAGWTANQFAGMVIEITGGTGAGQFREIASNTSDTITVSLSWATNPASGSTFKIYYSSVSSAFNTWVGGNSSDGGAGGNWSRYLAPGAADHVGIYGYPGGNNPSMWGAVSVANMVVGSTGRPIFSSGGSLSVSGNLFNYGWLITTQPVSGSSDVGFFNTGNYGGLLINPNSDNLGDTTVIIKGNQDCTTTAGDTVQRCFDITPSANNTGINKIVTFFFDSSEESGNACTSLEAYHFNGSTWDVLARDTSYGVSGRSCGTNPQSIRVNDVNSFSAFALNVNAPTSITLVSFSGVSRSGNLILAGAFVLSLALLGLVLWRRAN
jgi:hypothetical protein